jgi:hypothetical protein
MATSNHTTNPPALPSYNGALSTNLRAEAARWSAFLTLIPPRSESDAAKQPWEDVGISRRTYYGRKAKEANASPSA